MWCISCGDVVCWTWWLCSVFHVVMSVWDLVVVSCISCGDVVVCWTWWLCRVFHVVMLSIGLGGCVVYFMW